MYNLKGFDSDIIGRKYDGEKLEKNTSHFLKILIKGECCDYLNSQKY